MTIAPERAEAPAWTGHRELVETVRATVADRLADEQKNRGRPFDDDSARQLVTEFTLDELERHAAAHSRHSGEEFPEELEHSVVDAVLARILGLGWFEALLADDRVENIRIAGVRHTIVEYCDGEKRFLPSLASTEEELVEWATDFARRTPSPEQGSTPRSSERRLDRRSPAFRLRLPGGARFFVVDYVCEEPNVFIRRHRLLAPTLRELAEPPYQTLSHSLGEFLADAVRAKLNIAVAGAMNAGKTTMVQALAAEFDPLERVAVLEADRELSLDPRRHPDVVSFEAQPANTEDIGEVPLTTLLQWYLGTSSNRLVLNEAVGDETVPFLDALGAGAEGSLFSVHARTPEDVFPRLSALALAAPGHLQPADTAYLAARAIDVVVHMAKIGPRRVVTAVSEVLGSEGNNVVTHRLWTLGRGDVAERTEVPFGHRILTRIEETGIGGQGARYRR